MSNNNNTSADSAVGAAQHDEVCLDHPISESDRANCYSTLAPPPPFITGPDGTVYPVYYDREADLSRIDPGPRKGLRQDEQK